MTLEEFLENLQGRGLESTDLIEELWRTDLSVEEKITLSLELNELEPSYAVLMSMWLEYDTSNGVTMERNDLIYSYYFSALSNPEKDLKDSIEYSLYFDILEDPNINREAWNYFLNNNFNSRLQRIMLANSGPVPYDLKHLLYERLIDSDGFHSNIYNSIRHSCFDNCGKIDKEQALEILNKLRLADKIEELDSQKGVRKYKEVVAYLMSK